MMCQPAPDAPVQVIGDGKAGIYDLVGPSQFALADLPALINGHIVPISRLTARGAAVVPGPPATVADVAYRNLPAEEHAKSLIDAGLPEPT